ncbi:MULTISPECIES: helix-turn-helix domain-containing protein [unclassified Yoonia]|uniref:helix-turn-helix domain-containing protein n=1 Tax=unclassified Yoonia TaxID=2629118 RepID=UPI002AFE03C8|nr:MULTISPECIES: helix-turn-helix domain-containing protein [unclassified Yoonia]
MHAATLNSPRLLRLLKLLRDGRPHSTRDIARRTGVLAISACVAELRQHGADIICERKPVTEKGEQKHIWNYTMLEGPKE